MGPQELMLLITGNSVSAQRAMGEVSGGMTKLQVQAERSGGMFGNFLGLVVKAAAAVTAVVGGVTAVSVDLASKFNTSMSSVGARANLTTAQVTAIGKAFLSTAGISTYTANEIALAFAPVSGQLALLVGHALDARDSLRFMNVAMRLAEATGGDLAGTTKGLASIMAAYRLNLSQVAGASDNLFNASVGMNIPMEQLTRTLALVGTRLGPLAPSIRDTTALLLDLGLHGGPQGQRGLMQVTAAFNTLLSGSKGVNAEVGKLHLHLYTANHEFVGMQSVIAQLAPHLEKMDQQTQLLTLRTLLGAGASKQMYYTILAGLPGWEAAAKAADKHGTAETAAAKATDNMKGALDRLKGMVTDAAITWGERFTPVITQGIDWLNSKGIPVIVALGQNLYHWIDQVGTPAVMRFGTWIQLNLFPVLTRLWSIVTTQVVPAAQGLWTEFAVHVLPILTSLWTWLLTRVLPALGQMVTAFTQDVLPVLEKFGAWVWDNVITPLIHLTEAVIPPLLSAFTWIEQHFGIIFKTVLPLAAALATLWAVDKVEAWGKTAVSWIAKVVTGLGGSGISGVLGRMFPTLFGSGASPSTKIGGNIDNLAAGVQKVYVVNMPPSLGGVGAAGGGADNALASGAAGQVMSGAGGGTVPLGRAATAAERAASEEAAGQMVLPLENQQLMLPIEAPGQVGSATKAVPVAIESAAGGGMNFAKFGMGAIGGLTGALMGNQLGGSLGGMVGQAGIGGVLGGMGGGAAMGAMMGGPWGAAIGAGAGLLIPAIGALFSNMAFGGQAKSGANPVANLQDFAKGKGGFLGFGGSTASQDDLTGMNRWLRSIGVTGPGALAGGVPNAPAGTLYGRGQQTYAGGTGTTLVESPLMKAMQKAVEQKLILTNADATAYATTWAKLTQSGASHMVAQMGATAATQTVAALEAGGITDQKELATSTKVFASQIRNGQQANASQLTLYNSLWQQGVSSAQEQMAAQAAFASTLDVGGTVTQEQQTQFQMAWGLGIHSQGQINSALAILANYEGVFGPQSEATQQAILQLWQAGVTTLKGQNAALKTLAEVTSIAGPLTGQQQQLIIDAYATWTHSAQKLAGDAEAMVTVETNLGGPFSSSQAMAWNLLWGHATTNVGTMQKDLATVAAVTSVTGPLTAQQAKNVVADLTHGHTNAAYITQQLLNAMTPAQRMKQALIDFDNAIAAGTSKAAALALYFSVLGKTSGGYNPGGQQHGGIIDEPMVAFGMRTGKVLNLGEGGLKEAVVPLENTWSAEFIAQLTGMGAGRMPSSMLLSRNPVHAASGTTTIVQMHNEFSVHGLVAEDVIPAMDERISKFSADVDRMVRA